MCATPLTSETFTSIGQQEYAFNASHKGHRGRQAFIRYAPMFNYSSKTQVPWLLPNQSCPTFDFPTEKKKKERPNVQIWFRIKIHNQTQLITEPTELYFNKNCIKECSFGSPSHLNPNLIWVSHKINQTPQIHFISQIWSIQFQPPTRSKFKYHITHPHKIFTLLKKPTKIFKNKSHKHEKWTTFPSKNSCPTKKKVLSLRDNHTQLNLISAPEKLYLKKTRIHTHTNMKNEYIYY